MPISKMLIALVVTALGPQLAKFGISDEQTAQIVAWGVAVVAGAFTWLFRVYNGGAVTIMGTRVQQPKAQVEQPAPEAQQQEETKQ